MNKRIIYENKSGGISVLTPVLSSGLSIEDLARKDVPAGVPYKIVDVTDIPTDRTFRNAWEADFSSPDGYGIGHAAWFAEREGNV
jgi:hypothetical protein